MYIKVEAFLACEYLKVVDEQYFIIGGGWKGASFAEYPAIISFAVATRLAVYGLTNERSLTFDVTMENAQGQNVLAVSFQPSVEFIPDDEGFESVERMNLPFFFPALPLPAPGDYRVVMAHDGEEVASTSLRLTVEASVTPRQESAEAS